MNEKFYDELIQLGKDKNVQLIAVSKTKTAAEILKLYDRGQRDFGENRVQELMDKKDALPADIRWHLIGHLQTNKVKYIAPFIHLIHSVDNATLMAEINRQAKKCNRVIPCLMQVHIATEDSKFGWEKSELFDYLKSENFTKLENVRIAGLMGMATFTTDENQIRNEFASLKMIFDELKNSVFANFSDFETLSMGMSSDYKIAIEQGATMIRVGSLLFGKRE